MNEKTRTHLVRQLRSVYDNLTAEDAQGSVITTRFARGSSRFTLIDQAYATLLELLIKLHRESDWQDRFSEDFLRDRVVSLLHDAHERGSADQLESDFVALVHSLADHHQHSSIYTPIGGMVLRIPRFSIGNVTLFRIDEAFLALMRSRFEAAMKASVSPLAERAAVIDEAISRLTLGGVGQVCAEFSVEAEPRRAQERLISELRDVFDVLRFAAAAMYRHEEKVSVDFLGLTLMADVPAVVLADGDTNLHLQSVWFGPVRMFEVSSETEERMNRFGITHFSDILRKSPHKRTGFEASLMRSLHWFANAHIQEGVENRLLSLIVSLEILLTPPGGQPIGSTIAEAVAILLGSDVPNRKDIKRRVLQLYGLRSGVTHGGEKGVTAEDTNELTLLVGMVLVMLAENRAKFTTKAKLLDWLEERRLGGTGDSPT